MNFRKVVHCWLRSSPGLVYLPKPKKTPRRLGAEERLQHTAEQLFLPQSSRGSQPGAKRFVPIFKIRHFVKSAKRFVLGERRVSQPRIKIVRHHATPFNAAPPQLS